MIYATPFDPRTLQTTGPSSPAGFESLDQVVELLGEPVNRDHDRFVVYGDDEARVAYSDFVFRLEGVAEE